MPVMSDELKRTRKVRGGHRGSVKRIISTVNDILECSDPSGIAAQTAKLNQQKVSLQDKLKTLESLDEEILNLVIEEEIEEEIEQADIFKESVLLVIIQIERALATTQFISTPVHVNEAAPLISGGTPCQQSDAPPVTPTAGSPRVKLPKLELRKFNGDS